MMTTHFPEESAQELYENAPCGYLSTLPTGEIIRVNQTFLTWTGYTRQALLAGKRFIDLLPVPGRIFYETQYAPLLQMQGFVNEVAFDLLRESQPSLPVLVNSTMRWDTTGQPGLIHTTIFDATDRRKYEQTLLLARRQAEQLAAVVTASHDAILTVTPMGMVQSWNAGAVRMFGYTAEEAIGQLVQTLIIPVERREEFLYTITELRTKPALQFETMRAGKNGPPLDVSVSLTAHHAATGELTSISSIIRNISERKRAEIELREHAKKLAELNAELAHSNAELDAFAYSVAHDLKEPLRVIRNFAEFLLEDYADRLEAEGRSYLETLPRMVQRMETLIDTLLRYAQLGQQELELGLVPMQEAVTEAIELLAVRIQESGAQIRLPQPLPMIIAYRLLVDEVLMNLISNALKYNDKPEKWVEIGMQSGELGVPNGEPNADVTPHAPPPIPHCPPVFYIRDNGIGIAPEHEETIFRIFRRLHGREEHGGGIGAGLTIVKRIVERHGGRIWVESELNIGTTFFFTLESP